MVFEISHDVLNVIALIDQLQASCQIIIGGLDLLDSLRAEVKVHMILNLWRKLRERQQSVLDHWAFSVVLSLDNLVHSFKVLQNCIPFGAWWRFDISAETKPHFPSFPQILLFKAKLWLSACSELEVWLEIHLNVCPLCDPFGEFFDFLFIVHVTATTSGDLDHDMSCSHFLSLF